MKKEDFINLLENYSSKYTDILRKRDEVLTSIKNGEIPDGCPSIWTEVETDECSENVFELNEEDSLIQCKKCWSQVLK
jgi:hypothetical protein